MWSSTACGGEPDPELLRRMSAPENEIPVAVPLHTVLARTGDAAVAVTDVEVYSTGVSFTLAIRVRRPGSDIDPRDLNELLWERGGRSQRFLIGVELADGRRATNLSRFDAQGDVVFSSGGGGGGDAAVDQSWWLSPLPPDGPLRFVVRCAALGIEETSAVLDGAAIRRAARDVVELWPWAPPDHGEPPPPPPPDLPEDSWFSGAP